jgi:hypothetical protein
MKNLMAGLLVLVATVGNATFIPASDTLKGMAPQRLDARTRTAQEIAARAAAGYHYASVDMDDVSFKEEKQIALDLQSLGYAVEFGNDHHVYGWNNLNGALVIRWVDRHTEPLFGDR